MLSYVFIFVLSHNHCFAACIPSPRKEKKQLTCSRWREMARTEPRRVPRAPASRAAAPTPNTRSSRRAAGCAARGKFRSHRRTVHSEAARSVQENGREFLDRDVHRRAGYLARCRLGSWRKIYEPAWRPSFRSSALGVGGKNKNAHFSRETCIVGLDT